MTEQVESASPAFVAKVEKDLHARLLKTAVLETSGSAAGGEVDETGKVCLSGDESAEYLCGVTFGKYMIVLKKVSKRLYNQILNFSIAALKELRMAESAADLKENWNMIATQLDSIGITLEEETIDEIAKERQQEHIDKLFARVERYMKIICGGDEILAFADLQPEDTNGEETVRLMRMPTMTDAPLSDLLSISKRQSAGQLKTENPLIGLNMKNLQTKYNLISIDRELHDRLLKVQIVSPHTSEDSNAPTVSIISRDSLLYNNGVTFARYIVIVKKVAKRKFNQILNFSIDKLQTLQIAEEEADLRHNWQVIAAELDTAGITLDEETIEEIATERKQEHIDKIFARFERYMKIIAGPTALNFDEILQEDLDGEESARLRAITLNEGDLSDLISLKQMNTVGEEDLQNSRNSPAKIGDKVQKQVTHLPKLTPDLYSPSNSAHRQKTHKEHSQLEVDDVRTSDGMPSLDRESKIEAGFQSDEGREDNATRLVSSPIAIVEDGQMLEDNPATSPKEELMPVKREPKVVKAEVDILSIDPEKDISKCESSFELILVSLSRSFMMKPKQAAALLTNNNQYLIMACIKGVKGGKYDPLIAWYKLLESSVLDLVDLLSGEIDQLPDTARQTFTITLAAIGCGFYSYSYELVQCAFSFFKKLYTEFQKLDNMKALEYSLKWFFNMQESSGSESDQDHVSALLELDNALHSQNQTKDEKKSPKLADLNLGGLKLSLYALRGHQSIARQAVELYDVLCSADEQVQIILKEQIQVHLKSVREYLEVIGDLLPHLHDICKEKCIRSGIIDYWVDMCSREAENENRAQTGEKIIALAIMADIWHYFTEYVDNKEEMASTLLFVLKRAVRERHKSTRLISIAQLFKLLENLSDVKNKSAPMIFKTLIFSLIENPNDPTIRELYLSNFKELFTQNPTIPIALLLDPLLKQIKQQLGTLFQFKVFDFDFFMSLASHPKLNVQLATDMVALFGQIAATQLSYASISQEIVLAMASRFLTVQNSPVNAEILTQFSTLVAETLEALLDLEPTTRQQALAQQKRRERQNNLRALKGGASQPALPYYGGRNSSLGIASNQATPSTIGKPPLKAKDLSHSPSPAKGTSSKAKSIKQSESTRRLKKSLFVTLLLRIQNLHCSELNDGIMKDCLLDKLRESHQIYAYFNKGMIELLKYYGDPEQLIVDFNLDGMHYQAAIGNGEIDEDNYQLVPVEEPQIIQNSYGAGGQSRQRWGQQSQKPPSQQQLRTQNKARSIGKASGLNSVASAAKLSSVAGHRNNLASPAQASSKAGTEFGYPKGSRSSQGGIDAVTENNLAVIPYQGTVASKQSKSVTRARAQAEIEKIRKIKINREEKKKEEETKLRLASARKKKRLRTEIEKRKFQLGIASKVKSEVGEAFNSQPTNQSAVPVTQAVRPKAVVFVNINEEEDRDREAVNDFMKKYQKLWRNIFAKYQFQGFKAKAVAMDTYDKEQNKVSTLTFAEIVKVLKDHNAYPSLLGKDELTQMVRLVNQKSDGDAASPGEMLSLTYNGFKAFILQLACHCFSKPGNDLSREPLIKSLEALFKVFEASTKKRNQSTLLYEDPDAVAGISAKDRDMLKMLNTKVATEPDYPVPDGYQKVKEKVTVSRYEVPASFKPFIGEAKATAVELVDELVSKLFDIHILEPIVSVENKYRVKLGYLRQQNSIGSKNRADALSIIRRAEEAKTQSTSSRDTIRSSNKRLEPLNIVKKQQQPPPEMKEFSPVRDFDPKLDLPLTYTTSVTNTDASLLASVLLENIIRQSVFKEPTTLEQEHATKNTEKQAAMDKQQAEYDKYVAEQQASQSQSQQELQSLNSQQISGSDAGLPRQASVERLEQNPGNISYAQRKKLADQQALAEKRLKEKKRAERQKKLKDDLAKLKEEGKDKESKDKAKVEAEKEVAAKKKEDEKVKYERRQTQLKTQIEEQAKKREEEEAAKAEQLAEEEEKLKADEQKKKVEQKAFFERQQTKLAERFEKEAVDRKAAEEAKVKQEEKEKNKRLSIKRQVTQKIQDQKAEKNDSQLDIISQDPIQEDDEQAKPEAEEKKEVAEPEAAAAEVKVENQADETTEQPTEPVEQTLETDQVEETKENEAKDGDAETENFVTDFNNDTADENTYRTKDEDNK